VIATVIAAAIVCGCDGGAAHAPELTDAGSASGSAAAGSAVAGSATPTPIRTGPLPTGPGVLPGEKPPVEPELAKEDSAAGAFAFAAYFMRILSWSIATNDSWLLQSVSAPSCTPCKKYIDGAQALHARHQEQVGGRPFIKSATVVHPPFPVAADYATEFVVTQTMATLLPSKTTLPAKNGVRSIVYVTWTGENWLVVDQAAPEAQ
jgi:hypothetical protein